MAKIAFSCPLGRVEVYYPDEMSIPALSERLAVHLSVAALALGKPHDPPSTGVEKGDLKEGR